jgi:tRNA 2-selenouridine synthase
MPVEKIQIKQFLQLAEHYTVFDVRSPAEYKHAYIPGAYNLPLFTDEERKVVGTAYKQQSREAAIKIGLDFFGSKMRKMIEEVESVVENVKTHKTNATNGELPPKIILVHCWRGGMRSAGVAWLFDLYGFKVYTLIGGYKQFRNYVLQSFELSYDFKIVGGFTGSGKTQVLNALKRIGEKVIDLEALACHKGSAFGAIEQPPQPSQEMFENLLYYELQKNSSISNEEQGSCIWLEDESQRIGLVNIHQSIWNRMRKSTVFFIDIPFEERLDYVVDSYGKLDKEKMVKAIIRIGKRLGGLETKTCINYLLEDKVKECFRILLKYYDKYYLKGLQNRVNSDSLINMIKCEKVDPHLNVSKIITYHKSLLEPNLQVNE